MIGKLFDKVTNVLQAKLDVLKLNAIERIAIVMGFCMFMMFCMMAATAVIIFVGMGLSIFIGSYIDSEAGGYFVVSGIYIALILLVFLIKKDLLKWFAGIFVSLLTKNDDDDNQSTN